MKSILVVVAMSILVSAFGQSSAPRSAGPVFDQGGRQIAYVYPAGKQDGYKYDAKGRMTHFTDRFGQVTVFEYSANGTLLSVTRPDGSREIGTRY